MPRCAGQDGNYVSANIACTSESCPSFRTFAFYDVKMNHLENRMKLYILITFFVRFILPCNMRDCYAIFHFTAHTGYGVDDLLNL